MLSCAHFGRAFDKLSQIYNISAEKYANREKKQNWKRAESDDWLNKGFKEFKEFKEFREFRDYLLNFLNLLNLLTQPSIECTNFLKYFDFLKKVANFTRFYKRIKFFTLNYKQNS